MRHHLGIKVDKTDAFVLLFDCPLVMATIQLLPKPILGGPHDLRINYLPARVIDTEYGVLRTVGAKPLLARTNSTTRDILKPQTTKRLWCRREYPFVSTTTLVLQTLKGLEIMENGLQVIICLVKLYIN